MGSFECMWQTCKTPPILNKNLHSATKREKVVLVARRTAVLIFISSDLMHPLCLNMTGKLLTRMNSIKSNKKNIPCGAQGVSSFLGQFFLTCKINCTCIDVLFFYFCDSNFFISSAVNPQTNLELWCLHTLLRFLSTFPALIWHCVISCLIIVYQVWSEMIWFNSFVWVSCIVCLWNCT